MPSIAQAEFPPSTPKLLKRRRDDTELLQKKLATPRHNAFPEEFEQQGRALVSQDANSRHIIPILKTKRVVHDMKRQRVEVVHHEHNSTSTSSPIQTQYPETNTKENSLPKKSGGIDLSPCHICRRKPNLRSELDAFADCEDCGKRTCYICIRECLGSSAAAIEEQEYNALSFSFHGEEALEIMGSEGKRKEGHKGMVCSRCCVERGTEGEVLCLGCCRAGEES